MRQYLLECNNSPRIMSILFHSLRAECGRRGRRFLVLRESPTEIVIESDCDIVIMEQVVVAVREESFLGEHFLCTLI